MGAGTGEYFVKIAAKEGLCTNSECGTELLISDSAVIPIAQQIDNVCTLEKHQGPPRISVFAEEFLS